MYSPIKFRQTAERDVPLRDGRGGRGVGGRRGGLPVGFGRIIASETEAPNLVARLV